MASDLTAAQARLSAQRAKARRAALGPPLAVSDADLDAMAEAGPPDVPTVEAFVRDAAGQKAVDLLRASHD